MDVLPAPSAVPNNTTTSAYRGPKFDNQTFVLHTDIFILAIFALFSLFTIPRLLARYSNRSEWALGHILRAVPSTGAGDRWKRNFPVSVIPDEVYNTTMETGSEDSHTLYSHTHLVSDEKVHVVPKPVPQSWSQRLHLASAALGRPFAPGYTLGRIIVLLGYLGVFLYACYYKSNPFTDYVRTGYVAMAQFPIVVALATKNNVIGSFLAVGYEKLNYLHRFGGRLVAIAASIHVIGYFYKWSLAGTFQEHIQKPMFLNGFLSLMGLNLLVFFSTAFWRQRCYNVFMFSHIAGMIMFPLGLCLHTPDAIPWVVGAAAIYGVDHVLRIIKSRISEVTLRPMPDLGIVRVEVPHVNAGWRAGQHVRLRVLSSGMGPLGWAEVHPFTIASVGGDGMVLMCKKAGSWTSKLYDMATGSASPEKGGVIGAKAKVIIEGPYGGIGHTMMDKYSGALFVCGGSGITFGLAAMQELIQKDIAGRSCVKALELVWCVQNPGSVMSMLPTFASLTQQAPFTEVRVSVYYTRSSVSDPNKLYGYLPPNITLTPGRPRIDTILDNMVDRTCSAVERTSGFFVGACGPVSLGEQVRSAVGRVDSGRRKAVGGVELCEEVFGW